MFDMSAIPIAPTFEQFNRGMVVPEHIGEEIQYISAYHNNDQRVNESTDARDDGSPLDVQTHATCVSHRRIEELE